MRNWKHLVNIKQFLHNFDANTDRVCDLALEVRKELLAKLPAEWLSYDSDMCDHTFMEIMETLEDMSTDQDVEADDFDYVLNDLYDWADYNRVWLWA